MLNVAENADETGYVADVGFVDLDKLHEKVRAMITPTGTVRAVLKAKQEAKPSALKLD